MNKLLEQLRTMPAFNKFEAAIEKNLDRNNFYVQDQMPETEGFWEEDDDDGKVSGWNYKISDDEAEQEGIDNLLEDKEMFMEFLFEDLNDDVYELCKALVEEIRK